MPRPDRQKGGRTCGGRESPSVRPREERGKGSRALCPCVRCSRRGREEMPSPGRQKGGRTCGGRRSPSVRPRGRRGKGSRAGCPCARCGCEGPRERWLPNGRHVCGRRTQRSAGKRGGYRAGLGVGNPRARCAVPCGCWSGMRSLCPSPLTTDPSRLSECLAWPLRGPSRWIPPCRKTSR